MVLPNFINAPSSLSDRAHTLAGVLLPRKVTIGIHAIFLARISRIAQRVGSRHYIDVACHNHSGIHQHSHPLVTHVDIEEQVANSVVVEFPTRSFPCIVSEKKTVGVSGVLRALLVM